MRKREINLPDGRKIFIEEAPPGAGAKVNFVKDPKTGLVVRKELSEGHGVEAIKSKMQFSDAVRITQELQRECVRLGEDWNQFIESWLKEVIDTYKCSIDDMLLEWLNLAENGNLELRIKVYGQHVLTLKRTQGALNETGEVEFRFTAEVPGDGEDDGGGIPPTGAASSN